MKVPFYDTINIERVPELMDVSPEIQGKFEYLLTVREGDKAQSVYIFKFSRGKGCRDITSPLHEVLPPCTLNKVISDRELILLKGDGKLGTAYFYKNQPNKPLIEYTDEGYNLKCVTCDNSSLTGSHSQEEERGDCFITAVSEYLKTNRPDLKFMRFSAKKILGAEDKVSPFSGGGDMVLFGWPLEKKLVVQDDGDGPSECSECSPIDNGEQRLATNVEMKDLTSQSDKAVEKQLKANMHLMSSSLAVAKLKELENVDRPVTWLKELKTFTSYGVSFGQIKPVVILKLTMDLVDGKLRYEKRYESVTDADKAPRLACAMEYVITRMTSQSPEPREV